MQGAATFEHFSKKIAADFLNSVLIVDDRARLAPFDHVDRPVVLTVPGRQGRSQDARTEPHAANGPHDLYAKPLIDSFAKVGILCGVFRPENDELDKFKEKLGPVTERTDVLILDWVMGDYKNGEAALRIIKYLLNLSKHGKGRARLILIYSGETDLGSIANSICTALDAPVDNQDPFTICSGTARICIYAKEGGHLPPSSKHRSIAVAKLPDVVVAEFVQMTGGLVSNVALKSLGALRSNTHQLLTRFDKRLDAAYITHKTLLLPEEAAHHLVPLVVSEIQAILEDAEVWEVANNTRVLQWVKYQIGRGLHFSLPSGVTEEAYLQGLSHLLKHGAGESAVKSLFSLHKKFADAILKSTNYEKAARKVAESLTNLLTITAEHPIPSDQNLAVLMSTRSRYGSPAPKLGLGTIVLETHGKQSRYLLCVQPRCDSVRIDNFRSFPFLPLKVMADHAPCNFIIADKGKSIRLNILDKPYEALMISFKPARSSEREILARRAKNGLFFKSGGSIKNRYRWVGDLKPDHAQRVVNNYAYRISRVGLTESEWLRKLSLKGDE
jgi:hypothetical protein